MDALLHDLRLAFRRLLRSPGFTAVAIATLALGIGASTAMFTLVDRVLLRPLGHEEPERLVMLWERPPRDPDFDNYASPANFTDWREEAESFEAISAFVDWPVSLTGDSEPEEVQARLASPRHFEILGTRAQHGRVFTAADEGESVVVLSHRFWQRRYGGDPSVLDRTLTLNGSTLTVVGVLPSDFQPVDTGSPDVWLPQVPPAEARGRYLRVVGRLAPGVGVERARTEMRGIADRLAAETPEFNASWSADVVPLHEQETGEVRTALLVLLGAVGMLLLIACANLANLLLGRTARHRKDLAIRLSLGATRWELVRQALVEAVVLAVVAGGVGLLLATWGLEVLTGLVPAELALPRLAEVGVDLRVAGFALGLSLLTAVLFGAGPALVGSAVDLGEALRDAMRGSTGGQRRLRRALVVAEVGLAVVLLAGAGLLGRSLVNLLDTDTGLRTEQVLTMRLSLSGAAYPDQDALRGFTDELMTGLGALPAVEAAGSIVWLPLSGSKSATGYRVDGRPRPEPGEEPGADIRIVAGDYHRALGIPVRRGRTFDARDREDAPRTFVVNEALAEQQFPGENPVGRRLIVPWGEDLEGEIVGVVGNVRESGLDQEPAPAIYWAYRQMPSGQLNVVLRTAGDPVALAGAAREVVGRIDPNQPVAEVRTMEQVVSRTVAGPRFNLALLGGFAAASLLLAALGLFGVVSYSVAQRRQELGVRMALGATSDDLLRLVVGEGMALTGVGLAIGVGCALVLTRLMAGMLHGVSPTDPWTLAGVSAFLALIALLASWIPARRAARVDPMIALRNE